jgi:transglutaminase-like putative cysteine protease
MMLDRAVLDEPLLDADDVDLEAAERVTYVLDQRMHYSYDAPIESLRHRLMVLPPLWHGDQHRRGYRLDVSGAQVRRSTRLDVRGNPVVRVSAERVDAGLEFRLAVLVDRGQPGTPAIQAMSVDPRLTRPTRLTRPDEALTQLAHDTVRGLTDPHDRALAINRAAHAALTYEYGITSVSTTAAEALAGGRGVCQDSAHIMLAMGHALGIAGRYVSGHLIGQGGTHAWVEMLVGGTGSYGTGPDGTGSGGNACMLALDPCNGRVAGRRYLTIATGRDYVDVAPTSGSYEGTAANHLVSTRRLGVLRAA